MSKKLPSVLLGSTTNLTNFMKKNILTLYFNWLVTVLGYITV